MGVIVDTTCAFKLKADFGIFFILIKITTPVIFIFWDFEGAIIDANLRI